MEGLDDSFNRHNYSSRRRRRRSGLVWLDVGPWECPIAQSEAASAAASPAVLALLTWPGCSFQLLSRGLSESDLPLHA